MHIVLHTQYYPPEIGAPQTRLHELAVRLVKQGIDVTVLTAMPSYPRGRIYEGYGGWLRTEIMEGVRVIRTAIYPTQSPRMLPRLRSYFSFVLSSLIIGILKLKRADYLYTESPPLFLGLAGFLLSRWKRARWIFNIADLWPESVVELGMINREGLGYKLSTALEEFLYKRAWVVTGQSRTILQNIQGRLPELRTYHFPNGVDTSFFQPNGNKPQQKNYRVYYAGLHGLAQGLEQIILAAQKIPPESGIEFNLLGDGPEKQQLIQMTEDLGVNTVHFLDPLPHEKIPGVLQTADAIIVPLKVHLTGAVPSKLYEAMSIGKPVILMADSEPAQIVRDSKCGLVASPGDVDGLVAAIHYLRTHSAESAEMGINGRIAAIRNHDRQQIAENFGFFLTYEMAYGNARSKAPAPAKAPIPASSVVKRGFDLFVSFFGLMIFSPMFLLAAILIKHDSPGPVFFRSARVGRNGKVFQILKFRTMRETAESKPGPSITARDDSRITPLGRWLRVTKLNEFPQLWNVLKGEMSLVGPRPEDPEIVATWSDEVRQLVLSVRPGMTSPASVIYRNEEELLIGKSMMDVYLNKILPDKLRLDQLYISNHSLLNDVDVIFWTLIGLLPRIKHATIPENTLFWGPLSTFINRYFTWFVGDFLAAFIAVAVSGIIWRLGEVINLGIWLDIGIAIIIAILFSIINALLGLDRVSWRHARPAYIFELALSSGLTTAILFLLDWYWQPRPLLPLGMILIIGLLAFFGFTTIRYRVRLVTGLATRWVNYRGQVGSLGDRVLIVGAGECGQMAAWLLQKSNLSRAFCIVGMVDDDPRKLKMRIDGHTVIGNTGDIPELVKKQNIGVILYAISKIGPSRQEQILKTCRALPVRLVIIPDLIKKVQEYLLQPDEIKEPAESSL